MPPINSTLPLTMSNLVTAYTDPYCDINTELQTHDIQIFKPVSETYPTHATQESELTDDEKFTIRADLLDKAKKSNTCVGLAISRTALRVLKVLGRIRAVIWEIPSYLHISITYFSLIQVWISVLHRVKRIPQCRRSPWRAAQGLIHSVKVQ
jgi:hypothetical protein